MAPCHLAKQKDPDTHSNWSQQEANSVPILPQSASWHEAGGRNPHSNHLCRSTVRFGSKNRLQRSRKRGPRDAGALRVGFSLILGLVGTVDRFQGQQAPVVIYSMTTASPEDAPRGMEFSFQPEPAQCRNVARSRLGHRQPPSSGARVPQSAANAVGECPLLLLRNGSTRRDAIINAKRRLAYNRFTAIRFPDGRRMIAHSQRLVEPAHIVIG